MKKLICLVLLTVFSLTFVFAAKKICMSPYNQGLADLMSNGLGLTVNKASKDFSIDYLSTGDKHLTELVLSESDSEILVVPQVTQKDGLYVLKIHCYIPEEGKFKTIYSSVSQLDGTFPVSSLVSIIRNITKENKGLVKLENYKEGSAVLCDSKPVKPVNGYLVLNEGKHTLKISSYSYRDVTASIEVKAFEEISVDVDMTEVLYSGLTLKSDVPASVLKDSVILGQTPYTLESYSIPLILRLRAEGYADSIVNISKESKSIDIKMKPGWMENGDIYNDARDEFYRSFARSILVFGAKVAFKAIESYKPQISKIGVQASQILLAVSVTDLVYDLFNYCRYATFISP